MIKPEQIPDEVVDAVEKVMNRYLVGGLTQSEGATVGHAVVAAALAAWPDGMVSKFEWGKAFINLPLPTENSDE